MINDHERFQVYLGHYPCSMSLYQLLHYGQMGAPGATFQDFDYGDAAQNIKKYGVDKPPLLDVSQIGDRVPIAMYVGLEDVLAEKQDSLLLKEKLGEAVVHYEEFESGHLGFLVGEDMSYFERAMEWVKQM